MRGREGDVPGWVAQEANSEVANHAEAHVRRRVGSRPG